MKKMWKKIFISALVSMFVFGSGGIESTWAVRPLTQEEMGAAVGGSDSGGGGGTPTNTHDMVMTDLRCYPPLINPGYKAPQGQGGRVWRAPRFMGQQPPYPYGGSGYVGEDWGGLPLINTVKAWVKNKGDYTESGVQVGGMYTKYDSNLANRSTWYNFELGNNTKFLGSISPGQTKAGKYAWDGTQLNDNMGGYYLLWATLDYDNGWLDDNWNNNEMTTCAFLRRLH